MCVCVCGMLRRDVGVSSCVYASPFVHMARQVVCMSLDTLFVCPGVWCGSPCDGSRWLCEYLEVCVPLYVMWVLLFVMSLPRSVAYVSVSTTCPVLLCVPVRVVCAFAFCGCALRVVSVLHG